MKYQGEELVRVESESELHAGLLVVCPTCVGCSQLHALVLIEQQRPYVLCRVHGGVNTCPRAWVNLIHCPTRPSLHTLCLTRTIEEGRLWRLKPDAQPLAREREKEIAR